MGFGIWSMHYLGMLAFRLPVAVLYHLPTILLSLALSIFASGAALLIIDSLVADRSPVNRAAVTTGALLMGGGIAAMHYTGMAAMRSLAVPQYDTLLVLLSLVVAVAFSAAAIDIAVHAQQRHALKSRPRQNRNRHPHTRLAEATVMGLGIAAVHYTGMAAARFVPASAPFDSRWTVHASPFDQEAVAAVAILVLTAALLSTSIYCYRKREALQKQQMLERLEESDRLSAAILESAALSIVSTDLEGTIRSVNRAAERMLGYEAAELIGKMPLTALHDPDELAESAAALSEASRDPCGAALDAASEIKTVSGFEALTARARQGSTGEREWTYLRKDGQAIPVRLSVTALRHPSGESYGFLAIAQDVTPQKEAERSILHMSMHDVLTGLPNRALLTEQITRSLALAGRHGMQVALAVIDLDRFKQVNDSLGHHVGDEVLITVASRLNDSVRASDMVIRLGGDTFAVLMPGIEHPDQSRDAMQRVMQMLSEPIFCDGHELYITPSIGISSFPDDGYDLDTLLRKADRAMRQARERGQSKVGIFTCDLEPDSFNPLEMESALRRALKSGEFFLMYQPIFSFATWQITGVESLIRWRQSDGNVLPPADFIPFAEETGFIAKIGEWVLRTACAQAAVFSCAARAPVRIAVNISPRQFREPALFETITGVLAETGMRPDLLELEITEGLLLDDQDEAAETIARLRAIGIQITMDDFGIEYSSLGYLKRFPIDRLKIDRSFVTDIRGSHNDLALTSAIIALGHSLNVSVTAEGVESERQWDYLRSQGCDEAQGFHLARPMLAEEAVSFLRLRSATALSAARQLGPTA